MVSSAQTMVTRAALASFLMTGGLSTPAGADTRTPTPMIQIDPDPVAMPDTGADAPAALQRILAAVGYRGPLGTSTAYPHLLNRDGVLFPNPLTAQLALERLPSAERIHAIRIGDHLYQGVTEAMKGAVRKAFRERLEMVTVGQVDPTERAREEAVVAIERNLARGHYREALVTTAQHFERPDGTHDTATRVGLVGAKIPRPRRAAVGQHSRAAA